MHKSISLKQLDEKYENEYSAEVDRILKTYPDEMNHIYDDPELELDESFLGFLYSYNTVHIPNDFTIFDFGCNTGIQSEYFQKNVKYIGVDVVSSEYRFNTKNSEHIQMSIQDFIKNNLPKLQNQGLDLNKSFAFCSYVPDKEATEMVSSIFPYHRIIYCNEIESENLPPYLNFQKCIKLLNQLVENDILKFDIDNPDNILVYREKGENSKEGWYSENIFSVAKELLKNGNSQQYLQNILEEKTNKKFDEPNKENKEKRNEFEH